MIIVKIFYIVLRDLFTSHLFDNILNVTVDKFNESLSHFSFFKNVIL